MGGLHVIMFIREYLMRNTWLDLKHRVNKPHVLFNSGFTYPVGDSVGDSKSKQDSGSKSMGKKSIKGKVYED